jgi:protein-S-isoprenylcysteine O-methyltransferase Ste14
MELKVAPVIVFLVFVLGMYLLSTFLPFGFFDFFGRVPLVKILVGLAVGIGVVSLVQFFVSKTTVNPNTPDKASRLISNGLYTFSRNPMYLAMLLLLLAVGLYFGNAFNTLIAAGFVGYMNRFQIGPEEHILLRKFGKKYTEYLTRTRRWF